MLFKAFSRVETSDYWLNQPAHLCFYTVLNDHYFVNSHAFHGARALSSLPQSPPSSHQVTSLIYFSCLALQTFLLVPLPYNHLIVIIIRSTLFLKEIVSVSFSASSLWFVTFSLYFCQF